MKNWASLLPFALLKARCTPYQEGFTLLEIMFGRLLPLLLKLREVHKAEITNCPALKSLQTLQQTQRPVHHMVQEAVSLPMAEPAHKLQPGDCMWVKRNVTQSLKPPWKDPYPVVLTTPTSVKITGVTLSINHSQLKEATEDNDKIITRSFDLLKIRLT